MRNSHGAAVGEKFDPFQRVGIYIPGGTAPLVSTALMTVTLARVAGRDDGAVANKQFIAANPVVKKLVEQIRFPSATWSAWQPSSVMSRTW